MSLLRIVLDTNCLLRSVSRRSEFSIVLNKLYSNEYELFLTTEILLEYEEKLKQIFSSEVGELLVGAFSLLPNVKKIDVHYHLNLISIDEDDNKFVDCAFASNANFLVTDDKHFNLLKNIQFPSIKVISLSQFKEILEAI